MNPLLIAKLGGILAILAAAYFAVAHYNSVIKHNVELTNQVATLTTERDTYKNITETMGKNEATTQTIIQNTRTKEIEIREQPTTTNCVNSPAIRTALDGVPDTTPASTKDHLPTPAL